MKIFHVISGLNDGGAESVLYRLCISDDNSTHHIVCLMGQGKYGPLLEKAGVRVTCLNMPNGRVTVSGLWLLYCLLRREKPSVVQTWMYHADFLGGVLARLAGIKNIFWNIRHSELESGKSKHSTILVAKACAILSKRVPKKIVCCAEKAKKVHVQCGYDADKMVVVGNGYDLDLFRPDRNAGILVRNELGLSQADLVLGMVGRFNVQKNYPGLLKSLSLLKANGIDFTCALVGENINPSNRSLCEWIAEQGLEEEVLLLDQRTDIPALMNALDVHILSSSFGEGFPNVLAEAMACGTPCVSTDVGDASRIVGDTGFVVPVKDDQALGEAMFKIVTERQCDAVAWSNRSSSAVERVAHNFSLKKMVAAYHAVWNL